jgi:Ca2+-binding EF-hand superfamily protein
MSKEQREALYQRVKDAIRNKKLRALDVYRMADDQEKDAVSVISLKNTFQQYVPELRKEDTISLLKSLDLKRSGFITRADFEIALLDDREDLLSMSAHDSQRDLDNEKAEKSMKGSRTSIHSIQTVESNVSDKVISGSQIFDKDDSPEALTKDLGKAIKNTNLTPEGIFDELDFEEKKSLPLMVMFNSVKEIFPKANRTKLMNAFKHMDKNRDGFIDRGDFCQFLSLKSGKAPANPTKPSKPKVEDRKKSEEVSKEVTGSRIFENEQDPGILTKNLAVALKDAEVSPETIYMDIDREDKGSVPVLGIFNALKEIFPKSNKKKLMAVCQNLDYDKDGFIIKGDFYRLAAVDPNFKSDDFKKPAKPDVPKNKPVPSKPEVKKPAAPKDIPEKKPSPAPAPIKPKPGPAKPADSVNKKDSEERRITDSEFNALVSDFKKALKEKKVNLDEVIKKFEMSQNKSMSVLKLTSTLQLLLPDYQKATLLTLLQYVDMNKNGFIEKGEFELLIGYDETTKEIPDDEVAMNFKFR